MAQSRPPTVERPAPFDSAGRVLVITPALAARLRLEAPGWPVAGPFAEARLFTVDGAGAVLSVARPTGAVERYALDPAERDALVAAVNRAIVVTATRSRSDTNTVVSEPAGNGFVRTQAIRGATVYGPAVATLLSDEPTAATLGYAVALGAAYGAALGYSRSHPVTRAQAYLSGNMAFGGAAAAAALTSLFDPDDEKVYAATILAGGIGGTIVGVRRAAGMTDAEATSSGTMALLAAGTAGGIVGAAGGFDDDGPGKIATVAAVGGLALGYALGPSYARQRRYTVTAGDAQMLLPAALTGAAIGGGLAAIGAEDARVRTAAATAGGVVGILLADRAFARRFDYSTGEAGLARLGTLVGAGVGAALAASAEADEGGIVTLAGLGGLVGLGLTAGVVQPARAGGLARFRASPSRLRLSPVGAALLGAGMRGRYSLGTLTF